MFLEYYGLRDQPFGVTPDPRYLYFSATHREALGSLFYGIETGCGFLTLIAPPGLGKTTLLTHLLDRLRNSAQTAFLFHTQCDSREFLSQLLMDLGVDGNDQNLARMYESLQAVLLRNARTGRRFVLVIDEAQNLADSVLETVRLLSDFETPQNKLMQIVLCGQPQLADRLSHHGLIQLRQRISIVSKLAPLSSAETLMYIDHRIAVAGHSGPPLFHSDAVTLIAAHSAGIPRNINNICFNALTLGYAKGQKQIDTSIVREVFADLDLSVLSSNKKLPTTAASDSLSSLDSRAPANEYPYFDFHAAVRAAWEREAGGKTEEGCLGKDPIAILGGEDSNFVASAPGRNIPAPAPEYRPWQDSAFTAKRAVTREALPVVAAPQQVESGRVALRPGAGNYEENCPRRAASSFAAPGRPVESPRCELNRAHGESDAPTSANSGRPAVSIETPAVSREELHDSVRTSGGRIAGSKASGTRSEGAPRPAISGEESNLFEPASERRIPQLADKESQIGHRPGLTEVLTAFYGPSLTPRVIGPPPQLKDPEPTSILEAGS